jgi:hypothetical protein
MRINKRFWTGVILAGMISSGACKKKDGAKVPALSAPEQVFSAIGKPDAAENLLAEAEATASKGPVQLTLRIYKKKIRAGQSLHYQIELKNIGAKPFPVAAAAFRDPWAQKDTHGVYLDIVCPDGQEPGWASLQPAEIDTSNLPGALPPPDSKEGASLWQKLKGMADWERAKTVGDYVDRSADEYKRTHPDPNRGFLLQPGASTSTPAWVLQDKLELANGMPRRQPVGRFTELVRFDLSEPGKYRIRAIYDYRPPKGEWITRFRKENNIAPDEAELLVETPFVRFEVLP